MAPLVADNCTGCHHEGGLEFSLSHYADAHAVGTLLPDLLTAHTMPPWPPTTDGDCPDFVGNRRLPEADIDLVKNWVSAGMPKGTGPEPMIPPPQGFGQLDGISVEIGPSAPYTPVGTTDDYRCFLVDPQLATDKFITAYRVAAGAGVHHVQLWEIPDDATDAALEAEEAMQTQPGFPCLTWEGGPYRFVTVWGPTDPVRKHPAGTGIRLHAGKKDVIQVHYHVGATTDQTHIGLVLADQVAEEARIIAVANGNFALPPRLSATSVHAEMPMTSTAKLWGVRAHMHYFGTSAMVRTTHAGTSKCLLSIPQWDPNWQLMYFYDQPIPIAEGDTLSLDCTYNTLSASLPVTEGPFASNEMCYSYYYMTGLPPD